MKDAKLSEENKSKIVKTGLYSCQYAPNIGYQYIPNEEACRKYHCKNNWTYTPTFHNDGGVFMWNSYDIYSGFELTDENFGDFKFVFDFEKVKKTDSEDEYDENKVYFVEKDIRKHYKGDDFQKYDYWIDIGTKKSKMKLVKKKESEIEVLKWQLSLKEQELKEIHEGVYLGEELE